MASSSSEQGSSSEDDAGCDPVHFDIPDGTTRITEGSWARWGVDKARLTSVTIPDSVTVIETAAFEHCESLAAVTTPSSVTVVETAAFFSCSSLAAVAIPSSVTVIESEAFAYCRSLAAVATPSSVTVIERGAFTGCLLLAAVTTPEATVTELAGDAFADCPALRAVDYGRVADLAAPNRYPHLNGVARTATVEHPLGAGDSCVVWRTWPASTTELEPEVLDFHGNVETPAAYAGTEPDQPAEVLDATGIASPIPLQDLGGNECVPGLARVNVHAGFLGLGFLGLPAALGHGRWRSMCCACAHAACALPRSNLSPSLLPPSPSPPSHPPTPCRYSVHGCWAVGRPTADFKQLAATQHPEALGDPATWAVLLPTAEVAVNTLDLAAVATMLARGELSLAEPWLLLWKDGEAGDEEGGGAAPATLAAVSLGPGDGGGEDCEGGDIDGGGRGRAKLG